MSGWNKHVCLKVFFEIEVGVVIESFGATDLGVIRELGNKPSPWCAWRYPFLPKSA